MAVEFQPLSFSTASRGSRTGPRPSRSRRAWRGRRCGGSAEVRAASAARACGGRRGAASGRRSAAWPGRPGRLGGGLLAGLRDLGGAGGGRGLAGLLGLGDGGQAGLLGQAAAGCEPRSWPWRGWRASSSRAVASSVACAMASALTVKDARWRPGPGGGEAGRGGADARRSRRWSSRADDEERRRPRTAFLWPRLACWAARSRCSVSALGAVPRLQVNAPSSWMPPARG